jgi:hypothetical protein
MNDEGKAPGGDPRARIDAYLDAIDRVLTASGMSRAERRNVCDDVETQIQEMLAKRAGDAPSVADVEAVLAELDPPEAYAVVRTEFGEPQPAASEVGPVLPARFSRTAIAGAVWAPLFFIAFTTIFMARRVKIEPDSQPPGPAWWQYVLMLTLLAAGLVAPFGTTVLGIISIAQIRQSARRLYGMALAVFDALLFPLFALDVSIYWLWSKVLTEAPPSAPANATALLTSIRSVPFMTLLTCAIVDAIVILLVWNAATRSLVEGQAGPEESAADQEKRTLLAKIALGLCLGGILLAGLVAGTARALGHDPEQPAYVLFLACQIAAFVLGVMSWRDPLGKAGAVIAAIVALVSLLLVA